ncbi:MAG: tetratricopeptide repeat protein [Arenicellales bacterium WSBS_2016_MAG_OTU3]
MWQRTTKPLWYSKAAEQGHDEAQNDLGDMYYNGIGVAQDYKAAVEWYSKVGEQGIAEAQHSLGEMYEQGLGVAQDNIRAYMWFNLAASNGADTEARDEIAKEMTPADIEEAQRLARDYLGGNNF